MLHKTYPKLCLILAILAISFFAFCSQAFAHVEEGPSLSERIADTSVSVVTIGGILIILLVILAIAKFGNPTAEEDKKPVLPNTTQLPTPEPPSNNILKGIIFGLICFVTLGATFYLSGATIYLNLNSDTGGPVHWHADFRLYECGKEVFLAEPTGLSNRIGKPDLHEHGDGRIHVEGVVVKKLDMALHEFFEAIGGTLTSGEIMFPGREERKWLVNGATCGNDTPEAGLPALSGKQAKLSVFLYKTMGKTIRQFKLENYTDYVISPHSQVPPGDCLIFEFTSEVKDKTDKICNFTEIGIKEGRYQYVQ